MRIHTYFSPPLYKLLIVYHTLLFKSLKPTKKAYIIVGYIILFNALIYDFILASTTSVDRPTP